MERRVSLLREEQRRTRGVLVRKNFRLFIAKAPHLVQYWAKMVSGADSGRGFEWEVNVVGEMSGADSGRGFEGTSAY
jgi:hypothetical protein